MRSIVLIIALGAASASAQSNLPACQGSDFTRWSSCFGTVTFANGNKYVGEFRDGKFHGRGAYNFLADDRWKGAKYFGDFSDGMRHGQGSYTLANGNKYVGEYSADKFNGQGTYTFINGDRYVGVFRDGNPNGQGLFTFADGRLPQEGIFENGRFVSEQRISDHIAGRTSSAAPVTNSSTIESASAKCVKLGFKKGTEKFGDCVLKISE